MIQPSRYILLLLVGLALPVFAGAQVTGSADSLTKRGVELNDMAKYGEAEEVLKKAMTLFAAADDSLHWYRAAIEYAESLVDQAKYRPGLDLFQQLSRAKHDSIGHSYLARVASDMGWTYDQMGKLDSALIFLRQSLDHARTAQDSSRMATINNNLGMTYRKKGDYLSALRHAQKALPLYKDCCDNYYISIGYNNLGLIYRELSIYDLAKEYYMESLELRKRVGNPDLLATVYNNLAYLHSLTGSHDLALVYYEKSLSYRREVGNPTKTAYTFKNIGELYGRLEKPEKALAYYQEALTIQRDHSGPIWNSATLMSIGDHYIDQGDTRQARQAFTEALALRRELNNPVTLADTYLQLAQLESTSGRKEEALQWLKQALKIARAEDLPQLKMRVFTERGRYFTNDNRTLAALKSYRMAYSFSKALPPYQQLWPAIRVSQALYKTGSDSAFHYGEAAIEIIENVRTRAGASPLLKAGYFEKFNSFYNQLAYWYVTDRRDFGRAIELVEASKARTFADEIAGANKNLEQSLSDSVRIRKRQLELKIDRLFSEINSVQDPTRKDTLQEQLRNAELTYDAYLNKIRERQSSFRNFQYPEPITRERVARLADEGTAIMEYAVIPTGTILFLITDHNIEARFISLEDEGGDARATLERWVTSYRQAIRSKQPVDTLEKVSAPLTRTLIMPFWDRLSTYNNLIIVPDGPLVYLPFEALRLDQQYLLQRFNSKYEPSLTLLSLLETKRTSYTSDLLAIAGGRFSGFSNVDQDGNGLTELPSTNIEVTSIASSFSNSSVHETGTLDESQFKQMNLTGYRYLHLATHGLVDESRPSRNGLYLSSATSGNDSQDDGILRSPEIYALNIPAELVVLSACNTALGKRISGEGLLGLQRSFFYAGTATVVSTIWSVYDRSSAILMNRFYQHLHENRSGLSGWWDQAARWFSSDTTIPFGEKAVAMNRAKESMLQHPKYRHPVYWAPFIVVGR